MGVSEKSNLFVVSILLTVTAFSCSPSGLVPKGQSSLAGFKPHPAKLSGVLDLKPECPSGYYQIKLQGLFDTSGVQVTSQTDQTGHFNLVAPPGHYMMVVSKDQCGAKQAVDLEDSTEHMVSVLVASTAGVEKTGEEPGRIPASILILPQEVQPKK